MGTNRHPTEGGSGGRRGHSNMEHWDHTDAIEDATRSRRRSEDRSAVEEAVEQAVHLGSLIDLALSAQMDERHTGRTARNPYLQTLIEQVPLAEKLPVGEQMLRSTDPEERILAVRMIREPMGPAPDALAALLDALEGEPEDEVLEWLVSGLNFRADPTALPTALVYAEHGAATIRDAAAGAIAACAIGSDQFPSAIEALNRLASDPDAEVRFSALFELGVLWRDVGVRDIEVRELFDRALRDEDPRLRQIADESLRLDA